LRPLRHAAGLHILRDFGNLIRNGDLQLMDGRSVRAAGASLASKFVVEQYLHLKREGETRFRLA